MDKAVDVVAGAGTCAGKPKADFQDSRPICDSEKHCGVSANGYEGVARTKRWNRSVGIYAPAWG